MDHGAQRATAKLCVTMAEELPHGRMYVAIGTVVAVRAELANLSRNTIWQFKGA